MSSKLTLCAQEYINSAESELLEELMSLIEFSGQSESTELILELKTRLKDKSCRLCEIRRILEILKIGFSSLNIVFVYECSLKILSRLRSLINRFQKPRDKKEQEILLDILSSIQEWSMLYGKIGEESTLFGKLYHQLISQGIEFPECPAPLGYDFLRAVIELRGSIFEGDKTYSRTAYKATKQLKSKLKSLLQKEKNDDKKERLLFVSRKIDQALDEYEQFKQGRISIYNASGFFPSKTIQEPSYKDSFDPGPCNDSMDYGVSEVFENNVDFEIDLELSGEWKGLKKDYVKIKDRLEGKTEEIEDLHASLIELQEMNIYYQEKQARLTESLEKYKENCKILTYENNNLKEKYGLYQEENKRLYENNSCILKEKSQQFEDLNLSKIEIIKLRDENCAQKNKIQELTSQVDKLKQEVESLSSLNCEKTQEIAKLNLEIKQKYHQTIFEENLTTIDKKISNTKFWAYSLANVSSIIYEDDSLQVGFRISTCSDFFIGNLYIGNKSSNSLELLKTKILSDNTGLSVKLDKEAELEPVLPGKKTDRMIAFKPTAELRSSPIVHISYNSSDLYILLPIALPLIFSKGKFSHDSTEHRFTIPKKPIERIIKHLNFYERFETNMDAEKAVLQCEDALIRLNLNSFTVSVQSSSPELTANLSQTIYNLILFL